MSEIRNARARVSRLEDKRCKQAGEHLAISEGRVNYGATRRTDVFRLCIFCNRTEVKWEEHNA